MCPAKPSSRIKKAPPPSRDSRKKPTRGRGKPVVEEPVVEETPPEPEDDKPKRDAWLDNLPPVIKPDEELHVKLTLERKAARNKKHLDICVAELDSMLNFAFHAKECNFDKKEIRRSKIQFMMGEFIRKPKAVTPIKKTRSSTVSFTSSHNIPLIDSLLDKEELPLVESMKKLMEAADRSNFMYDANPELDNFLQKLAHDMKPYTEPAKAPDPVPFPFIVVVCGPPCSGKSTISEFIREYFKVKFFDIVSQPYDEQIKTDANVICSTDDKEIVTEIIKGMNSLEEGCGVLLQNWPSTKGQITSFERALGGFIKQNKETPLNMIHGVFRTTMTQEEAEGQTEKRTIQKTTGHVYHPIFKPPNAFDLADPNNIIPFPAVPEIMSQYNKILQNTAALEMLTKKGTIYINVQKVDNIDTLHLAIENGIRQIYEFKQIPIPFTSFVHFVDTEQISYAKLCHDVLSIWNEKCVPLYAKDLTKMFSNASSLKDKIDFLVKAAKKKFALMLARPDCRRELCQAPPEDQSEMGNFFKKIWEKSIELKEVQMEWLDEVISKSGLKSLEHFLEQGEMTLLRSLITRFFLVQWFTQHFKTMTESQLTDPVVPEFDPCDLQSLCKIMNIGEYHPTLMIKSSANLLVSEEVQRSSTVIKSQHSPRSVLKKKEMISLSKSNGVEATRPFEPRISFCIGEDDNEQPLAVTARFSKEESINNFFEFVKSEMTTKLMRNDMQLSITVFHYLLHLRSEIDKSINNRVDQLKNELKQWIESKYSHEMEQFSKNFRIFKQGQPIEGPMYNFDLSFLDDETNELVNSFGNHIPHVDSQVNLPIDKIKKLLSSLSNRKSHTIHIDELCQLAQESGFTEDETIDMKIMVYLTSIPQMVSIKDFFLSLAPDVAADFIDALVQSDAITESQ